MDGGRDAEDRNGNAETESDVANKDGDVEVRAVRKRLGLMVLVEVLPRLGRFLESSRLQVLEQACSSWICESLTLHSQRGNAMWL